MKKVIFIFLILISCLCLAVVSCADKEESAITSRASSESADGYIRIGYEQIVWGTIDSGEGLTRVTFPTKFAFSPTVTISTSKAGAAGLAYIGKNSVSLSGFTAYHDTNVVNVHYIAIGKWQ